MERTNPSSAAQTYAAHRGDIARLLDVLQMELDAHAERAKAKPKDWGFAGDLAKARADLVNLVAFLSGKEPGEVEAFLAE